MDLDAVRYTSKATGKSASLDVRELDVREIVWQSSRDGRWWFGLRNGPALDLYDVARAEMERMTKLKDLLLRAMAKKITWWQAAEIIGVTDRTQSAFRPRWNASMI